MDRIDAKSMAETLLCLRREAQEKIHTYESTLKGLSKDYALDVDLSSNQVRYHQSE
jgi:hypothetical protein